MILSHVIEPSPFEFEGSGCFVCGGEMWVYECFDANCISADIGCDECEKPCNACNPRGSIW